MRTADDVRASEQSQDAGAFARTREMAAQSADEARRVTGEAADRAKETLRQQLDQRSTEYGRKVREHVDTLETISEQLRRQGKESQAQLVERARERADRVAEYLERADADTIMSDIEEIARRQPWLVGAAAFGIGVLGARFVKVSGAHRTDGSSGREAR